MIRVAYIGNFKHAHCTEVAYADGLERNGCEVRRIQQETADRKTMGWHGKPADLILYTRTHNGSALADGWTQRWRDDEERHGSVTASVHLDRFWDLEREQLIHDRDPLFTTQHVFTADGGNDERWADAGVNHHWLPPAIDAKFAHPGNADRIMSRHRRPIDVLFVGSRKYHPEYPQRLQLLRFLEARYQRRFVHLGPGGRQTVRGEALNDWIAAAKVVVGDSCFANSLDRTTGLSLADRYWSDRIPEVLGRGGVLVHPEVRGLYDWHRAGEHLATHLPGDWDDLGAVIDQLLAHDDARSRYALAGRSDVQARHTYTDRARTILETVGLLEPSLTLDDA